MDDLWRIVRSLAAAAAAAGVAVVTGDTKVVDRGKGDGVFINTTGIGLVREQVMPWLSQFQVWLGYVMSTVCSQSPGK